MPDSNAIVDQLASLMPEAIADKRHPVYVALGAWLIDVVLKGVRYKAVVEDIGYDVSTFSRHSDEPFDLSQYATAGEFLDLEIGPNTRATYMSGAGFLAETLGDVAIDVCEEAFSEWVQSRYPGVDFSDLWEDLHDSGVDAEEFYFRFHEWKLDDVMTRYLSDALSLRAGKREAQERCEREARETRAFGAPAFALMKERVGARGKFERNRLDELRGALEQIASELPDGSRRIGAALCDNAWPFESRTASSRRFESGIRKPHEQ
ncbi:hypothetical protein [Cupriavidus necator]